MELPFLHRHTQNTTRSRINLEHRGDIEYFLFSGYIRQERFDETNDECDLWTSWEVLTVHIKSHRKAKATRSVVSNYHIYCNPIKK